uniref:Uncharacterized protein n=1 Tax=Seriola dumerili TaxID=41447 RepID=A0A3B4TL68_SERDU
MCGNLNISSIGKGLSSKRFNISSIPFFPETPLGTPGNPLNPDMPFSPGGASTPGNPLGIPFNPIGPGGPESPSVPLSPVIPGE